MHSLSIAALALAGSASAIISGITAPQTVTAGQTAVIQINTADYIQTVLDVSAAFGLGATSNQEFGEYAGSMYLGPANSNTLNTINASIDIPSDQPNGEVTVTGIFTSIYGAGYSDPVLNNFTATTTVTGGSN